MNLREQIKEQEELLQKACKVQEYYHNRVIEWKQKEGYILKELNRLKAITEEPMNKDTKW